MCYNDLTDKKDVSKGRFLSKKVENYKEEGNQRMTLLFLIGVIEMVILTLWTKVVVETKVIASGVMTAISIFIWYYALSRLMTDISNTNLIVAYAAGCALGTMIVTTLSVPRYQQWLKKHYEGMLQKRSISIVTYDITS